MRKFSRFLNQNFLIILIFLPTTIFAQLSLEETFQLVEENNLSLKQLEQTIAQAEHEINIQRTNYFPIISSSASYNHISELASLEIPFQIPGVTIPSIEAGVKDQFDLALLIKQPVFTGFRTKNLIKAANQKYQAEQIRKDILHNQLLFQVGQLFRNVQLNLLQQEVLHQSIKRADLQLQKITNLLEAQQTTGFDTLEVANRKLQISNQLLKLQHVENILKSKLLFLLNVEKVVDIEIPSLNEIKLDLKDIQFYENVAITQRPELNQISALQKAQSFQVKVIQSMFYPQVFANATYHYARPGVNFFKDEWMNYYTFGVNLQWELWNWNRTKQQSQQTKLAIQQLDLKSQELVQNIKQEVTEVFQYLLTTKEQVHLQEMLVQQENVRYQIINRKFEQQLATTLDMSDSENKLREAELVLQNTYIEWFLYQLQMDYVTGIIGKN
jgi:outer membrane protein TolC